MESTKAPAGWSPAARVLFRFAFAYLVVSIFPFPVGSLPYTESLVEPYQKFWDAVVPWVARRVLGIGYEVGTAFNGSGDRTYDYVLAFCVLVLALAATVVWSLLDRRRGDYARLYQWLRVYVRLYLGTTMIGYGAYKVINSQFGRAPMDKLLQPFGDSSPMGLLWTFMSASDAYTAFTGAAEMLCGILLFMRRTTTLGALVCAGVMSNVVMLNFSYDVPVKLYSTHLLLMALFLLLPDARRLANLFLLNRAAEPAEIRPLFARPKWHRAALVLRTLFLLAVVGTTLYQSYTVREQFSQHSPLYGVWEVEEFSLDGETRPPLVGDRERWRRVVFDRPGMFAVQLMTDARQRYRLEMDEAKRTLSITRREDPNWKTVLDYEQPEPERLTIKGDVDGRRVEARLRRADPSQFLLTSRGFHWINEFPLNR